MPVIYAYAMPLICDDAADVDVERHYVATRHDTRVYAYADAMPIADTLMPRCRCRCFTLMPRQLL